MITVGELARELGFASCAELTQYAALHTWMHNATIPDQTANMIREQVAAEAEEFYQTCGCLKNRSAAHRVGCPDFPEGVRG